MADLYTTLVRAKQELRGELPPLTPLTPEALRYVDPAFVHNGLGILEEDEELGLRCPIRGCGEYRQALDVHLRSHDMDARDLRRILSLDPKAPLRSEKLRAEQAQSLSESRAAALAFTATQQAIGRRAAALSRYDFLLWEAWRASLSEVEERATCCRVQDFGDRYWAACDRWRELEQWLDPNPDDPGANADAVVWVLAKTLGITRELALAEYEEPVRPASARAEEPERRAAVQKRRRTIRERSGRDRALSAGLRNLFNLCDVQLCQRVLAVRDRVRRWPGERDIMECDPKLFGALLMLEWEWEHVVAWARLRAGDVENGGRDLVEMLVVAWANVNGRLPSEKDLRRSTPLLPPKAKILKAMGAKSWRDAMDKIPWSNDRLSDALDYAQGRRLAEAAD